MFRAARGSGPQPPGRFLLDHWGRTAPLVAAARVPCLAAATSSPPAPAGGAGGSGAQRAAGTRPRGQRLSQGPSGHRTPRESPDINATDRAGLTPVMLGAAASAAGRQAEAAADVHAGCLAVAPRRSAVNAGLTASAVYPTMHFPSLVVWHTVWLLTCWCDSAYTHTVDPYMFAHAFAIQLNDAGTEQLSADPSPCCVCADEYMSTRAALTYGFARREPQFGNRCKCT